jgi:uncharacterized protein YjbI with pentapeptide repeats
MLEQVNTKSFEYANVKSKINTEHYQFLIRFLRNPKGANETGKLKEFVQNEIQKTGWGFDFTDMCLRNEDMSGLYLPRSKFDGTNCNSTNFVNSNLAESYVLPSVFHRTNMDNVIWKNTNMHAVAMHNSSLIGANLQGIIADGGLFHGCNFYIAKLQGAILAGTSIYQCFLEKVKGQYAVLDGTQINLSDLTKADFRNIYAPNLNILDTRQVGTKYSHSQMYASNNRGKAKHTADISKADFEGTNLARSAKFVYGENVDFTNANLSYSLQDLSEYRDPQTLGVNLHGTYTRKTNLK